MCPVIIAEKIKYAGVVTPPATCVEVVIIDIPPQLDEYMVEGYLDISALRDGDSLLVTEYIALDGSNYQVFTSVVYSGTIDEPIIRFHTKTLPKEARYRVTVNQLTGTVREVRYVFIIEVMGAA